MWWGKYLGKLLGSLGGGHGVIPNTIRIFGKIPKYCVESRQHTNNSFMTGHAYFKLYPARMFIYLKYLCTRAINLSHYGETYVRRPRIHWYNNKRCGRMTFDI